MAHAHIAFHSSFGVWLRQPVINYSGTTGGTPANGMDVSCCATDVHNDQLAKSRAVLSTIREQPRSL